MEYHPPFELGLDEYHVKDIKGKESVIYNANVTKFGVRKPAICMCNNCHVVMETFPKIAPEDVCCVWFSVFFLFLFLNIFGICIYLVLMDKGIFGVNHYCTACGAVVGTTKRKK